MDFLGIKKAIGLLANEKSSLEKKLAKLDERKAFLENGKLCKQDVLDHLFAIIEKAKKDSSHHLKAYVTMGLINKGIGWEVTPEGAGIGSLSRVSILSGNAAGSQTNKMMEYHLLALLAEPAKDWLTKTVESWDWPKDACQLPKSERLKELEKVNREIAKIEGQLEKMTEGANQAGVRL